MKKLFALTAGLLTVPAIALAAAAVTPDAVKSFFDAYAILFMFVWGLIHTRFPALARVPNEIIPWVNAVGYIVLKFIVPEEAHAGVGGSIVGFGGLVWVTARGAATSAVTSLLYDKFAKVFLDRWLPKAVA